MVFHEITPQAIRQAVDNPREIDERLVDAQETRRILDRLYGYEVSPGAVEEGHAAAFGGPGAERRHPDPGRAREGAHGVPRRRLLGHRRRIHRRRPTRRIPLPATLVAVDGARIATGRDFTPTGQLSTANVLPARRGRPPRGLVERLAGAGFAVASVEERPYRRSPYAPFMTSTLQQEAGRKLRFSSQRTMQIAQRLYENGYITYMRTDSTALSETAMAAARAQARQLYGPDYVPDAAAHATPARSRTRRRRTRRSAPPATRSARPARSPASSTATSSGCTS